MTPSQMQSVTITAPQQAELQTVELEDRPLAADEVAGATLVTLISAGTELAWAFSGSREGTRYPIRPGYAAVFRVEAMGPEVTDLAIGDLVFAMGNHCSWQSRPRVQVCPVPEGLAPEIAVFARMMGVSMSTLITTTARPGDQVLVTGLGPVGHLAAKIFAACGYRVTAVEPVAARRELLAGQGLGIRLLSKVPLEAEGFAGEVALVAECSGHEQAALDGCRVVRRRGEVVLIGVPWARRTDLSAFELLTAVFHKYAVLRSGWEWEVPRTHEDFRVGSIFGNYATALSWLASGRVSAHSLHASLSPADCREAYLQLQQGRAPALALQFDWRALQDTPPAP